MAPPKVSADCPPPPLPNEQRPGRAEPSRAPRRFQVGRGLHIGEPSFLPIASAFRAAAEARSSGGGPFCMTSESAAGSTQAQLSSRRTGTRASTRKRNEQKGPRRFRLQPVTARRLRKQPLRSPARAQPAASSPPFHWRRLERRGKIT